MTIIDFSADSAQRQLVSELDRRFQAGIARRAAAADQDAAMPAENWKDIVDSGYLRLFHPPGRGGLGVDGVTQAMAMESLGRACGSTYWSATMSTLVCGNLISTYGNLAKHGHLVESILSGDQIGCFAVVERSSGSDPETYQTVVRATGHGYVINGEKARITNAPNAGIAVVIARLDEAPRGEGAGWCLAFVDLRQQGVRRYELPSLGLRAMPWGGLIFNDTPVGADDVIPLEPEEFPESMAWGWLFISISSIAIAQSALSASTDHASRQVAFGRPLAHMPAVHALLADMSADVAAARLLAWRAAWHCGEGRSATQLLAMLKPFATEMAVRVTQHAVQIHGSWALTRDHLVERLYRDAPMNVIGGFSSNRLRELVAEGMGLGASRHAPFDWLAPTGLGADPGQCSTTTVAQLGA